MSLIKYPRTRHVEGSRLQTGDAGDFLPISALRGAHLVVEEKLDGANCAISFEASGALRLQSRGHRLDGGPRERQFDLLKTWANVHAARFFAVLGARHIMYGEWLYAKHTAFYDRLPHVFLEFDVLDRRTRAFLSTPARRALLKGLPIMPAPVLHEGAVSSRADLERLIRPSLYKSPDWRRALDEAARRSGARADFVAKQTEDSDLAEGLYIKVEAEGVVRERCKYVRADFLQAIAASESHWHDRPILPNGLAPGVDLFAPTLGGEGAYDAL